MLKLLLDLVTNCWAVWIIITAVAAAEAVAKTLITTNM